MLEELELVEDEELWTDDDDADHSRLVLRRHRPVPVPGRRLRLRRRVHDRRAPDPRLGGARRPEPPPPRRAREAGRAQPAGRRVRARRSGRAPRTTPGRRPAGRCTAFAASDAEHRVRRSAAPWSLGVEEELFFVDAETLEAAPTASRGWSASGDERVKPEVFESLVELATPVVPDADAVLAELTRLRGGDRRARRRARAARLRGRHAPARASGEDQAIVPCRRYEQMVDVARRRAAAAARLRAARPRLDARSGQRRSVHSSAVVPWLPVAARALGQLAVRGRGGHRAAGRSGPSGSCCCRPAARRRCSASWDDWERRPAATDAPPLGRVAASRVRDARGARDGHADGRPPLGRASPRSSGRSSRRCRGTVDEPYDRELYARRREAASRLPPDPDEVEALAALVEPPLARRSSSSHGSCSTAGPRRSASSRSGGRGIAAARGRGRADARLAADGDPDGDDPGERHPLRACVIRLGAALGASTGSSRRTRT